MKEIQFVSISFLSYFTSGVQLQSNHRLLSHHSYRITFVSQKHAHRIHTKVIYINDHIAAYSFYVYNISV